MSSYIRHELFLLFQSVLMGGLLLLCYDCLAALRKILPHPPKAVVLEDLLYWTGTALFLFARIYETNQGILRNFLFLGILLGAVVTGGTISPCFVKGCEIILGFPVEIIKKIINRLLFWMKRCKILGSNSAHLRVKCTQKRGKQLKRGRQFEEIREEEPEKENRV